MSMCEYLSLSTSLPVTDFDEICYERCATIVHPILLISGIK
jgi:hypothetical protein